jgi:hypothetical protein
MRVFLLPSGSPRGASCQDTRGIHPGQASNMKLSWGWHQTKGVPRWRFSESGCSRGASVPLSSSVTGGCSLSLSLSFACHRRWGARRKPPGASAFLWQGGGAQEAYILSSSNKGFHSPSSNGRSGRLGWWSAVGRLEGQGGYDQGCRDPLSGSTMQKRRKHLLWLDGAAVGWASEVREFSRGAPVVRAAGTSGEL